MSQLYPLPSNDDDQESDTPKNKDSIEELVGNILDSIANGTALKDIYGIPDEMMDAMYAHAYYFYQKGKLDDATTVFQFLYTHDIHNASYVMGLAAIQQQKKNYAKAAEMYALSYELDSKSALTLLYAGQCYLFLKDREQARHCFSEFLKSDAPDNFKKQARAYLDALSAVKQNAGAVHE
jgi:type III secretion system low calcium response chaperone LcrH/SycD